MSWAALISSIIALVKLVLTRASDLRAQTLSRDGESIGRMLALKVVLDDAVNLMADAQLARRQFRDQLRAHPERLSDDDGHKRPKPTAATDGR